MCEASQLLLLDPSDASVAEQLLSHVGASRQSDVQGGFPELGVHFGVLIMRVYRPGRFQGSPKNEDRLSQNHGVPS